MLSATFSIAQGGYALKAVDACTGANIQGWPLRVDPPSSTGVYNFVTPPSGTKNFVFSESGVYFASAFVTGATVTPSGWSFPVSYPNGASGLQDATFEVTNPSNPNFQIKGNNVQAASAMNLYKCSGTNSVPLTNTSSYPSFISQYRITIFNSNASGVVGSVSNLGQWLNGFPSDIYPYLPATASGQFLLVRLEIKNACGNIKSRDALIKWSSAGGVTYLLNQFNPAGCVAQSQSITNPPLLAPISGGICGNITVIGNTISQVNVKVFQTTSNGSPTGTALVNYTIPVNGGLPQVLSFSQMAPNNTSFFMLNYNTYVGKLLQMQVSVFNDCGWSSPANSYFKLTPTCQYCLTEADEIEQMTIAAQAQEMGKNSEIPLKNSVTVLNNPIVDGQLVVKLQLLETATVDFELFDINGATLYKSNSDMEAGINQVEIDMRDMPVGTYYYRCRIGDEYVSNKIIKQ